MLRLISKALKVDDSKIVLADESWSHDDINGTKTLGYQVFEVGDNLMKFCEVVEQYTKERPGTIMAGPKWNLSEVQEAENLGYLVHRVGTDFKSFKDILQTKYLVDDWLGETLEPSHPACKFI
jgi:hypothetical protein